MVFGWPRPRHIVHVFLAHEGQLKVLEEDDGELVEPRNVLQEGVEQYIREEASTDHSFSRA